jgi:hypothetical protein
MTTAPTPSSLPSPPSPLARALVRSLIRGTAIAQGVRYIHVGHSEWLAAQRELLAEIAEDGHADTKFVRGAYGSGKSHFLSVVQDFAREHGWMTAHVECKVDRVQVDRFETLYPRIVGKLTSKDLASANNDDEGMVDPARHLLERWSRLQCKKAGIALDGIRKPFDAAHRLHNHFQSGLLQTNLPPDLVRALVGAAQALLASDTETFAAASQWLRGIEEKVRIPAEYLRGPGRAQPGRPPAVELRPIGKGTVHETMRGLLWLVRACGYSGLVLCIDEIEELAKLSPRKRQDRALQALREYVDHAGGEGGYRNLCMYLAATPEMFEGEQYFPRYDALATRIQPLSDERNWRAPVIDLDHTPLDHQQMREMARRIDHVYRVAYGDASGHSFNEVSLDRLLEGLAVSKLRIAKPRLLARVLVAELERARQEGAGYRQHQDIDALLGNVARDLVREAAS